MFLEFYAIDVLPAGKIIFEVYHDLIVFNTLFYHRITVAMCQSESWSPAFESIVKVQLCDPSNEIYLAMLSLGNVVFQHFTS